MRRMQIALNYLIATCCVMGACTLQDVEERGNSCPTDSNSLSIPYILVQTPDGQSSRVIPQMGGDYNDVLVYKKCPKEFPNCAVDHDGNNYCSSCPDGQILCNNKCINPETDINHCGASGGCNVSEAGSPDFQGHTCVNNHICENGYCELKCPPNKHSLNDGCADDDINNCGKHGRTCSQYIDGWANGECINGECIVSKCDETISRLIKEEATPRCERFTNEKCGLNSVDCGNLFCSNGECKASCMDGQEFCNNTTCVDLNNNAEHCGKCNHICKEQVEHAIKTTCSLGQCLPLECKSGWHINAEVCEQDSVENCGELGNTCFFENGTPKCEAGNCVIDHCDDGYIQNNKRCIQSDPNPQKPECIVNDDCTIAHGTGTCNISQKCEYTCDKLYKYDESTHLCVTTLVESDCIKDSDCNKINGASGTCNKGLCSYECPSNYHINQAKDACVPDSPTECGDIRENCVDSCLKGLTDSTKAIGICSSGLCQCGQCDEGSIANADHTKCEKDISSSACTAEKCITTNAGWKKAMCEDDQCKAIECETGYHIYNDQKKGSKDICELDTVERCGDPYVNCETEIEGWEIGNCSNGICTVTHCKPGYSVKNNKCIYRCPTTHIYCPARNKCCNTLADCDNSSAKCLLPLGELEVVNLCKEGQTNCAEDPKYCCDDPADCNSESTRQTKCASILTVPED